ncbi:beta-hydroxylase, aspartyl/asparaginyl family [Dictyocaulus viviparus]|uniref:Beta-hydroxylase, aspartyl/asparaginyl family n=1 Tax=Dictyocaulus viviparus TaxID=29172 RepID=A0A0D8XSD8_DICVI|nr:beta-hydroxylase, aspartyl/asparaginyl family [Dictyocaulus viviparus]
MVAIKTALRIVNSELVLYVPHKLGKIAACSKTAIHTFTRTFLTEFNNQAVERQWVSIRAEATHVLHSAPELWKEENPTITVDGRWIAFPLLENGYFNSEHCRIAPQTCSILREFRERSNASRSEMRFSALSSGAQILPHCGPTNSRLQAHLGLIAPSEARIRVGNEQRGWKTGKFIIFDDSFEHELQFDGASSASLRLILLIDLWHPEVESHQRSTPKNN